MDSSVDNLCQLLTRTGLLSADEVQSLRERWLAAAGGAGTDPRKFADWLIAQQVLTGYQADRLLRGQADHYFFNQYKLLDRIGVGRMAGVYKAVHRLGQVVAIKVLPPNRAKDPQALGRFQREARLALRLKHPNIVRTFQTGTADKLHYLVMEYLDGETLEDVLKRRGKLPPAEAVRVLAQALTGLQHLHEQDMIHRDLKPGNLMLVPAPRPGEPDTTQNATVKILDIGLGRALFDEGAPGAVANQELTAAGDMLGSPDYMAPEQARDAHNADIRSDIYGLGCVLYHTLTGQPPFTDNNIVKKISRHALEMPKPLREFDPSLPAGLQAVLDRMLAKDPAQRFATPAQAAQALQAALSEKQPQPLLADITAPQALADYETWLETDDPEVAAVRAARTARSAPAASSGKPRGAAPKVLVAAAGVLVLGLLGWLGFEFLGKRQQRPPTPEGEKQPQGLVAFPVWLKETGALPADKQVEAVTAKLKELNPNFDGQVKHNIEDGVVLDLEFSSDEVTNLAPVRALKGLKRLGCAGSAPGKGKLADLSPLEGMPLAVLDCSSTRVTDLTPLQKMPLIFLGIAGTQVRDLAPLQEMPLVVVNCSGTGVRDLGPLRGMGLTLLDAADAPIADLSPLTGMPLESLWCEIQPQRDVELLRSLSTLKEVNGKPIDEILKQAEAQQKKLLSWKQQVARMPAAEQIKAVMARLKELNPDFDGQFRHAVEGGKVVEVQFVSDGVTDLGPLQGLPNLQRLFCKGSAPGKGKLASLQPLKGMKLVQLDCGWTQVRDLTPLQGMPLTRLFLAGDTGVSDLAPLRGRRLTHLELENNSRIKDLGPLQGMQLQRLNIAGTGVANLAALQDLSVGSLVCEFRPARDVVVLRSLKGLERINNRPAADFWKDVDAQEQALAAFVKRVAGLPADEQVKAVAEELQKRNPGFDGKLQPRLPGGVVTELTLKADQVLDLTPLQALPKLTRLNVSGSEPGKSKLADLWPLKGLSLTALAVANTQVSDLTPLQEMPLVELDLAETPVSDLSIVRKLPLKSLNITHTQVEDLTALKDLPLRELKGDFYAEDLEFLRSLKTLVTLNGKPLTEASTSVAAAPRPARPSATGPKEKLAPTLRFTGKLLKINHAEKTLTVQISEPVVTQDPYHARCIAGHQIRLLEAQRIRNPVQRMRRIQEQLVGIAYHQSLLNRRHDKQHNLDLQAADDVKSRSLTPPSIFDAKGNQRKPSAKELKDLKGTDPAVPGYRIEFTTVVPQQMVEVHLARSGSAGSGGKDPTASANVGTEAKSSGPSRPLVVMIVVQ